MIVREISDRTQWEGLKPVWNPLLADSASGTTFLTWEWVTAWWSAYGTDARLRVLTVEDAAGEIRGIAPLRRDSTRRLGRAVPTLAFMVDGSNDSEYLDFIVARGFEDRAIGAWLKHLHDELADGLILQLNEIPSESPNYLALKNLAGHYLWQDEEVPCSTVRLPSSWNEYLGQLGPRFRTKVRSVLKNLEGNPAIRFRFCEQSSDLDRLLPALFELHTRRWNHDGRPGVFGWDKKRAFYHAVSPLLLRQGSLRLSWLEWNDRILACQYGFLHGDTYLHLQEGYEPLAEHWNLGIGLRAWSIREMLAAGVREYDFLGGTGRHKSDWGSEVKQSRRVEIAASTYGNRLFSRGQEWQRRTKHTLKTIVPGRVAAAAARHSANGSAHITSALDSRKEYLRKAVARCYFHLGGPAAARFVRGRYQVTPPGRRLPSWSKRQQPAGRILYYHRVNDDNDPFFPSLSRDIFERQMRHLARHYDVVSLSGLLDHLASGSSGTVMAITFDDGYADNYENAFPVLQRHKLPATIFLTTGSVDSDTPLWFDQLADVLKTTPREFLDLELDVPRRFWLRSRDERLRAHQELFGLLRRMPDDERKRQLSFILTKLGRAQTPGARLMLTWDRVRHMNQHGIDFGAHTVTHPYLSRLSQDQVAWELSESKRRIESELQKRVAHFAYPNGRDEDFASWNKDALRDAGYQAALTTLWGLNFPTTDRLELRRGGAWEQDEAVFAYKMDWYELVNG